jgi:hypothetical protein
MGLKNDEIVVYRDKWGRGSLLRNNSGGADDTAYGKMCCLGFAAFQCGVPLARLKGCAYPTHDMEDVPEKLVGTSSLAEAAANINDNVGMPVGYKEEALTQLFKSHGITIRFEDKAPPEYYEPADTKPTAKQEAKRALDRKYQKARRHAMKRNAGVIPFEWDWRLYAVNNGLPTDLKHAP